MKTKSLNLEAMTAVQLIDLADAIAREAIRRRQLAAQIEERAVAVAKVVDPRRGSPRPAPSKEDLEALMAQCRGNVLRIARTLGRKPALIYRWAKRYGLAAGDYRPRVEAWDPRAKHRPWMVSKPRKGGV